MRFQEVLFRNLPKFFREWIERQLKYANFTIKPENYFFMTLIYSIIVAVALFFIVIFFDIRILSLSSRTVAIIFSLGGFFGFQAFMYSIVILTADRIARFVDEILPDALRLISANLRAGLTPDKALLLSARPEFGPLQKHIRNAALLSLSGVSIEDAIKTIPENINSKVVRRSFDLLREGISKGGNLSHLLDGLAEDISQAKLMKKEVHAFVLMYAIFIFFAAGVGAPLLYGISSFLVGTMQQIQTPTPELSIPASMKSMKFLKIRGTGIEVSPEFLTVYSITALLITSVFGGLIIGLIKEGSEKAGLKYIPILLLLSLGVFYISRKLVTTIFGVFA